MTLKLSIVSEQKNMVGDNAVREFSTEGGSIGRSVRNDWILPDADRYISGRHAVIDYRGGSYYLADLSTNGVYVNDENEPIGRGNPRRLYDGDRLRMGDFEIAVVVEEGESVSVPLDDEPSGIPENVDRLVPEESPSSDVNMLDAEEITGDDAFRSVLAEPAHPAATMTAKSLTRPEAVKPKKAEQPAKQRPAAVAAAKARRTVPKQREPRDVRKNQVARPRRVEVSAEDLLNTFLDGLGMSRTDLHPSVDPAEVMRNAGEVMKEFVTGTAKLLASRGELKTAFRLDQTSILPRHNNPLKMSRNISDSIRQLLIGRPGEYLGPRDSVREVCRDLLFHQDAFLCAMGAAFDEFANRFDPDELAASFESSNEGKAMFGFMNKQKYWQAYCDFYPRMTDKGNGQFPGVLAEEFAKAYEEQLAVFVRQVATDTPVPDDMIGHASNQDFEEELKRTVSFEISR